MFKDTPAFSGFSVNDLAKAKDFYVQVLGLKTDQDEMGMKLHLAGGTEIFVYPKENHEPATYTMLNFVVENIDAAVADLEKKGVKFEHYKDLTGKDGIARGLAAHMGPDIAWFKDPAGNILSVLQNS